MFFVAVLTYLNEVGIKSPFGYTFIFILYWGFAGTIANFSIDYPTYKDMYNDPSHVSNLFLEPVWIWIADSLRFFGFGYRMWFLLVSFVILFLFFYGIKRLSLNIYISALLFLVCGFLTESMNGMRQYVAMAILFAAFPCVLEGKVWKYLIAVLIAAQFHLSAYVMLLLIFAVKIHYSKWILLAGLVATFVAGRVFMDYIFSTISIIDLNKFNNYSQNVDDTGEVNSGLLKIFYFLIGFSIILLYDNIKKLDKNNYLYINMVVLGIMIYNVFLSFQVAMRIYWYLFPFIIILVPIVLQCVTKKSKLILIPVIVFAFAVFWLKVISNFNNYSFDLNLF